MGQTFKIARVGLHHFEEPCISFQKGSGTIFFSGCNLRCAWCHNPESQSREKEILFYKNKCVQCGKVFSLSDSELEFFKSKNLSIPNSLVNLDLYVTPNDFKEVNDYIYEFEIGKDEYGYYEDGFDGWTTLDASNDGETWDTLFSIENNEYIPNYNESISIINSLFPKDKYIFLMCGGGGYASMTKNLLISLGYDQNKIYNVGGYWYYEGKNKVEVKQINENNEVTYNFDLVTYHNIDFNTLTKI